ARARLRERARAPDDLLRRRPGAGRPHLAHQRKGSARTPPRQVARLVAASRTIPRSTPLLADVLRNVMSKQRVVSELWQFMRQEKKYWLVPIVVVFVLFGLLIVFSQSSAVAPFIYTLF